MHDGCLTKPKNRRAKLGELITIKARHWWMKRRLREIAGWRCRCGRLLREQDTACAWHESVFAKALMGYITEEQAR